MVAGGVAIGLCWGWLVGGLVDRSRRPGRTLLAWAAAGAVQAVVAGWIGGWGTLPYFLAAAVLAGLLHIAWRQELHQRYQIPKQHEEV